MSRSLKKKRIFVKQALSDALSERGYDTLTPVQVAVTNSEHENADMLVSAQTGSGKTVGFGLAIAGTLLGDRDEFDQAESPLALVVAPTRELAMQVKRELTWLYAKTGAIVASCVGGMDMRDERRDLGRGAHIVVATPGRLRDHIMRGSMKMQSLRAIVLDEADEMLDLGFRDDLEFILGEAPETRRTLMFSATVPRSIVKLADNYQKDAVRIQTLNEGSQHDDIEYRAMQVAPRDAENAIINVLRYYEAPNAIVFCNTRAMVNRLTTRFSNRGFSVVALSGELTQNERTHALQAMRDGRARVCVATDVAARGIDLPKLELVIHAELPNNAETMLHRSGRTGRAGRKGVSAIIVPPKVRSKAERLLRSAKVSCEWGDAPSAAQVIKRDQERLLDDSIWTHEVPESMAGIVSILTDRFGADQLAAAYVSLQSARLSAPEELLPSNSGKMPKPKAAFGPSVWFSISGGYKAGAEPRRLLPMICKVAGIEKDLIGAIRVTEEISFVELSQSAVPNFVSALGKKMRLEGGLVTQLDKKPKEADGPKPSFADRQKEKSKRQTKARHDTPPIDWDDAPAPRRKKPKGDKAWGAKNLGEASKSNGSKEDRPKGVVKAFKGKSKSDPKNKGKRGKKTDKGAGGNLAPLVGKPNSKKNKARAKAAAEAAAKGKASKKHK